MRLLLLISAVITISECSLLLDEWRHFKNRYEKSYEDETEESRRLEIFSANNKFVDEHNAKYLDGNVTYSMEINQFADLTDEEFASFHLGFSKPCLDKEEPGTKVHEAPPTSDGLPLEMDWREMGAVTPVKNQGQCGSCWAFSVIGALEGQHFIKMGELVSLSEQQLVDCTRHVLFGNNGCRGGFTKRAFRYLEKTGADTEVAYPYQGKDLKCRFSSQTVGANMTGYVKVKRNSQLALQDAVANVGPVSVAIAVHKSFRFYKKGVYFEPDCGAGFLLLLNHAVLAVGYGSEEDGQEYWLVKNSWGERWGERGYIRMARNIKNGCGIAEVGVYPRVQQ